MKTIPKELEQRLVFKAKEPAEYPTLARIEYISMPCEDCDEMVQNRTLDHRKMGCTRVGWKTTCRNCGKIKDPRTGQFGLTQQEFAAIYNTVKNRKQ